MEQSPGKGSNKGVLETSCPSHCPRANPEHFPVLGGSDPPAQTPEASSLAKLLAKILRASSQSQGSQRGLWPGETKIDTQCPKETKIDSQCPKETKIDTQCSKETKIDTQCPKERKIGTQCPKEAKIDIQCPKDAESDPGAPAR